MNRRPLALALVAATSLSAVPAYAYDFLHSPTGKVAARSEREVVFRLPAAVPAGLDPVEVRGAIERALAHWSEASGLVLRATEGVAESPTGCTEGGVEVNDIVFVEKDWKRLNGAIAETPVCMGSDSGRIYGADVLLNAAQFRFAVLPADHAKGGTAYDLESVLVHELGHALGMDHSKIKEAAMWGGGERGDVSKRGLAEDDVVGIQSLYPAGAGGEPGTELAMGCSLAGGAPNALGLLALLALLGGRKRGRA
ncbi:MAG: matrixin family metalloprotease [Myxococcales bacterium]